MRNCGWLQEKGDSHLLCEAPEGPFRQKVAVTFCLDSWQLKRMEVVRFFKVDAVTGGMFDLSWELNVGGQERFRGPRQQVAMLGIFGRLIPAIVTRSALQLGGQDQESQMLVLAKTTGRTTPSPLCGREIVADSLLHLIPTYSVVTVWRRVNQD